jgi:hypothetical protein
MLRRWFDRKVRAERAADALLKVFAMFRFTPSQVIKIGSLAHLVELFGVNKKDVPKGIRYLLENDLLVRGNGPDLYLTQQGWKQCEDLAAAAERGERGEIGGDDRPPLR